MVTSKVNRKVGGDSPPTLLERVIEWSGLRRSSSGFYMRFMGPRSEDEDVQRREFILNFLLCGALLLAIAAFISSAVQHVVAVPHGDSNSLLLPLSFIIGVLILWRLSRTGHYKVGAYSLVGLFFAVGTYAIAYWSIEIPEGELIYALVIVMAGILIGSAAGVGAAVMTSAVAIFFAVLQGHHVLHPHTSWLTHPILVSDVETYVVTFGVIGLVSWLANREIDRSLARARTSETALAAERDSLEVKVGERTQALEQSQRERVLELERFAEFGRVSAGLLHDLANPLTTASLNLAELDTDRHSRAAQTALRSVRYVERYVAAARKQLQHESTLKSFSVGGELNQVVRMLQHKARAAGVKLTLQCDHGHRLYGDPVKFHQLVANLVANAIEAYPEGQDSPKEVVIRVECGSKKVTLTVHDAGIGIPAAEADHIFTPFYTNKRSARQSTGLGLSLVKQIAERDFGGGITVSSSKNEGTTFRVRLHNHPRRNAS